MRSKIAAALALGLLIALPPAPAAAKLVTQVTVFNAFTASGAPTFQTRTVKGYCWTGSIAADRKDAWRCFVRNEIYDPCFSSAMAPGYVACPDASLTKGILIKLTKPLPHKFANHRQASVNARPWLMQTVSGRRWEFVTGAANRVDRHTADYFSHGSRAALWGLPDRHAQPWTIYWARLNATRLKKRAAISYAWT